MKQRRDGTLGRLRRYSCHDRLVARTQGFERYQLAGGGEDGKRAGEAGVDTDGEHALTYPPCGEGLLLLAEPHQRGVHAVMGLVQVFGGDLERHLQFRVVLIHAASDHLQERYAAQDLGFDGVQFLFEDSSD